MSCEECRSAVRTGGAWNRFDNRKCKWCAARLIQRIKKQPNTPRETISARCTQVLKDAVEFGLDEQEIRALVREDMAVEPAAKTDVRKSS